VNILERIKNLLRPESFKLLSNLGEDDVVNAYVVQITKLSKVIDIFIEKEAALDALLRDFNRNNLQELLTILTNLKKLIATEFRDWSEFSEASECIFKLLKKRNVKNYYTILPINVFSNDPESIFNNYKEQFEIMSKNEKLLDDKLSIARLVKLVVEEAYELKSLFVIETKFQENLLDITNLRLDSMKRPISKKDNDTLRSFLNDCVNWIRKERIKIVLVTFDSARILGIMLLAMLKEQGLKNVVVSGFDPRPITEIEEYPYKEGATILTAIEDFKKERHALSKKIIGNTVLIIDEYGSSGKTLCKSKEFFEKLGANIVYTAQLSGRCDSEYCSVRFFHPDIRGGLSLPPMNINRTSTGRSKSFLEEGEGKLRTRTNVQLSPTKYKIMNDLYNQLVRDYKEFMKKIVTEKEA